MLIHHGVQRVKNYSFCLISFDLHFMSAARRRAGFQVESDLLTRDAVIIIVRYSLIGRWFRKRLMQSYTVQFIRKLSLKLFPHLC